MNEIIVCTKVPLPLQTDGHLPEHSQTRRFMGRIWNALAGSNIMVALQVISLPPSLLRLVCNRRFCPASA